MNAKQTPEGHIFTCEGRGEVDLVRRLLEKCGGTPLGDALLARHANGGGAFCVFHSEIAGFAELMSRLEMNMETEGDEGRKMTLQLVSEMKGAILGCDS